MTWNVRKLIFPRIQCTSITKRSFSLFDSLTAYYSCMTWNLRKQVSLRLFSAQVLQIVFSAYLTVLRLITTVRPGMSENSCFRDLSAQVSQIPFLSLFDRFTAYYNCMTWNVRKLIFLQISVHKYHKSCSLLILTVLRLITTVWPEMSENSYLRDFSAQVSQMFALLIWAFYGLLQLYDLKCWKNGISAIWVSKYHKSFS